jgi:hypothetical protein
MRFLIIFLLGSLPVRAQWREDSLQVLAQRILTGRDAAERFRSDSSFTRMLVRALATPHSFHYPFDSLRNISRVYAPDSSFRIFTWQVMRDEQVFRRHGAIQMKTPDGRLKLFPLIDRSPMFYLSMDTVASTDWWMGALYYRIIRKEYAGKPYYTLLGYDEHTVRSTRKVAEVLHFDASGRPRFGGPFFRFPAGDTLHAPLMSRFWIEYKKDGNGRMQFDEELDLIIFDHLISESDEPDKPHTFIPDGDYEGFRWENGAWQYIEKVFHQKLEDGQAPVVAPVKEKKFNR